LQVDAQSASVAAVHPVGQHPSPARHAVMGACAHLRVHAWTEPFAKSIVHASASSHVPGHDPGLPAVMPRSQVSPALTMRSPQILVQSESFATVQPVGQHWSALTQPVIGETTQLATRYSWFAPSRVEVYSEEASPSLAHASY
jgi:hypothetical protein